MFHSWLGKLIQHEPNDNLFQLETWVDEGGASYYGDRTASLVISKPIYKKLMKQKLKSYKQSLGGSLDLSIEDLAEKIGTGPPANDETQTILYAKSTLINYLLDKELKKLGFDLDILMKGLYENFGLTSKKWQQNDIVLILKDKTGKDFSDFFTRFLLTNKKLPIKGKFNFLKHADQCSISN